MAVAVGGVVADVVVASPQGRGRWSWQAVADARLFTAGAAIDVWLVEDAGGRLSFAPLTVERPVLASLGPGPLGTTVVRTAAGAAITGRLADREPADRPPRSGRDRRSDRSASAAGRSTGA